MPCLYCGKEIGAFQLLRDDEFCSTGHRKRYHDRLGRALDRIAEPELRPAKAADFCLKYPLQVGTPGTVAGNFQPYQARQVNYRAWPVRVPARFGTIAIKPVVEPPQVSHRYTVLDRPLLLMRLPVFSIEALEPSYGAIGAMDKAYQVPGLEAPKPKMAGFALDLTPPEIPALPDLGLGNAGPAEIGAPSQAPLAPAARADVRFATPKPAAPDLLPAVAEPVFIPAAPAAIPAMPAATIPVASPPTELPAGISNPEPSAAPEMHPRVADPIFTPAGRADLSGVALRKAVAISNPEAQFVAVAPLAPSYLPSVAAPALATGGAAQLAAAAIPAGTPACAPPVEFGYRAVVAPDVPLDLAEVALRPAGLAAIPNRPADQSALPKLCESAPFGDFIAGPKSLALPAPGMAAAGPRQLPRTGGRPAAPLPVSQSPEPIFTAEQKPQLPRLPDVVLEAKAELPSPSESAKAPSDISRLPIPELNPATPAEIPGVPGPFLEAAEIAVVPLAPHTGVAVPSLQLEHAAPAGTSIASSLPAANLPDLPLPLLTLASLVPPALAPQAGAAAPNVQLAHKETAAPAVTAPAAQSEIAAIAGVPGLADCWMQLPQAEPAARMVTASMAGELAMECAVTLPPAVELAAASRHVAAAAGWMPLAPEPVTSFLTMQCAAEPASSGGAKVMLPGVAAIARLSAAPIRPSSVAGPLEPRDAQAQVAPAREALPAAAPPLQAPAIANLHWAVPQAPAKRPAALPVESMAEVSAPDPILLAPLSTPLPELAVPQASALKLAGFVPANPRAAAPEAMPWNPHAAVLQPVSALPVAPQPIQHACEPAVVPMGDFFPTEYYVKRGSGAPVVATEWKILLPELASAPFDFTVVMDRWDEPAPLPVRKTPAPQKVAKIPEVPKRPSRVPAYFARIAACLVLGIGLWFGVRAMHVSDANNAAPAGNPSAAPTTVAKGRPANADGKPAQDTGALASVRRAIANRATVELTDTFHDGMQAWGAAPHVLASGWSRHPDGYMKPGDLALFHPSLTFKDYRLEFMGQVENKSMDWVVRANDKQNYYGMKVSVIESGLRPIIALTHYTVVGGKKANKVETPLNVMVHNNTPIRVAVDIRGNRFTTSIEGQQVDSWMDNSLVAGGVGFFSETGARARLYWMKVSKNTDWLGTVCSYLSSGNEETAELRSPAMPTLPAPGAPYVPALAALLPWPGRRRGYGAIPQILNDRRSGTWNS